MAVAGTVLAASAGATPAAWADTPLPTIPQTVTGPSCTPPSGRTVYGQPWPQRMLRPDAAWTLTQGTGVTVAVVDTGVDARLTPALAGQVDPGVDVVSKTDAGTDCVGHGTFVAGLIAARRRDTTEVAGIAPRARILAIRATDIRGMTNSATLAAGVREAVARHAQVVVVSVGVLDADEGLRQAVRFATDSNVLVVAPAVAGEPQREGRAYPANFPGVLSVAGIDQNGLAATSRPSGTRVDLVAPGVGVTGVGPGGDGYYTGSGASLAAGYVAGAAALVVAYHPDLTVAQVVHRLEATAYRLSGRVPDADLGHGIVDPGAAVAAVLPEESGEPPASGSAPTPLVMPAQVRQSARGAALAVAGGALLVVVLVTFGMLVIPRGRRRRWRPAGLAPGWPAAPAGPPGRDPDGSRRPDQRAFPESR